MGRLRSLAIGWKAVFAFAIAAYAKELLWCVIFNRGWNLVFEPLVILTIASGIVFSGIYLFFTFCFRNFKFSSILACVASSFFFNLVFTSQDFLAKPANFESIFLSLVFILIELSIALLILHFLRPEGQA